MRTSTNTADSNIVEGHFCSSFLEDRTANDIAIEKQRRTCFLADLTQAIESYFDDPSFGLTELSQEIGITQEQLELRCKEYVYLSPSKFLMEFRLNEAARLICEKKPLDEIAFRTGFPSNKEFCENFEARFGRSPKEQVALESHRYGVR